MLLFGARLSLKWTMQPCLQDLEQEIFIKSMFSLMSWGWILTMDEASQILPS